MMLQRIFNMNSIAKTINSLLSLDHFSGIYILQERNRCWATIYVDYVHRLRNGPLFSAPLCTSYIAIRIKCIIVRVSWCNFLKAFVLLIYFCLVKIYRPVWFVAVCTWCVFLALASTRSCAISCSICPLIGKEKQVSRMPIVHSHHMNRKLWLVTPCGCVYLFSVA